MSSSFVEKNHVKSYNYKMGGVEFNFSLRISNKSELVAFEEILKQALEEVQRDIKSYENKK